MLARLPRPQTSVLLNLSVNWIVSLQQTAPVPATETQTTFPLLYSRLVYFLDAALACVAWPDELLVVVFFFLLLLPLSHYDVPQQGLLGELILIQQQIQRHEEEVRRAAAANSARPPPPEPAPSPPPNPSPLQQKRKVKVPPHLDSICPTNGS